MKVAPLSSFEWKSNDYAHRMLQNIMEHSQEKTVGLKKYDENKLKTTLRKLTGIMIGYVKCKTKKWSLWRLLNLLELQKLTVIKLLFTSRSSH